MVKANKLMSSESPDPPEYKYVLGFQLRFLEAKKTNFENIGNRHFHSVFFLLSPVMLIREP